MEGYSYETAQDWQLRRHDTLVSDPRLERIEIIKVLEF